MKEYVTAFLLSTFVLFLIRNTAIKYGLVDTPSQRKKHSNPVPLVGGISTFFAFSISLIFFFDLNQELLILIACILLLVFVGVIDDYYDISFIFRLLIQIMISLLIVFGADQSLSYLGAMFSTEIISLNIFWATILTTLAIMGSINAFNMIDGMDGLLGGLSSISFISLAFLFFDAGLIQYGSLCLLILSALLPYIILNVGIPFGSKYKIFMGDAGSTFIGFLIIWMLLHGSQPQGITAFNPVTALWLIAIPLVDMLATILQRFKKNKSIFKADREHLHHVCQRIGFSPFKTRFFIFALAIICAFIGIWSDKNNIDENIMLFNFLMFFGLYFYAKTRIGYFAKWYKKTSGKYNKTHSTTNSDQI